MNSNPAIMTNIKIYVNLSEDLVLNEGGCFFQASLEAEVQDEYELNTGRVIVETLGEVEPLHTPGVVVYQHGPFAWGKDAHDAVHNAVVMEEVAKMAWIARGINPALSPIDSYLMNKHFMRKHGPNAYYGQK